MRATIGPARRSGARVLIGSDEDLSTHRYAEADLVIEDYQDLVLEVSSVCG